MPNDIELEIMVVDLAATYTLYATGLVHLAIAYNKEEGITEAREKVSDYGRRLNEDICRCNINANIPTRFDSAEAVTNILIPGHIVTQISNQLTREYSNRHENIFLFAVTSGGLLTAQTAGLEEGTEAAISVLERTGRMLVLPRRIVRLASQRPDRIFIELKLYLSQQSSDKPLPERWIATLKNNKVIAIMITLGIILIALATLTDAISTLYEKIIAPMLGKL